MYNAQLYGHFYSSVKMRGPLRSTGCIENSKAPLQLHKGDSWHYFFKTPIIIILSRMCVSVLLWGFFFLIAVTSFTQSILGRAQCSMVARCRSKTAQSHLPQSPTSYPAVAWIFWVHATVASRHLLLQRLPLCWVFLKVTRRHTEVKHRGGTMPRSCVFYFFPLPLMVTSRPTGRTVANLSRYRAEKNVLIWPLSPSVNL